MDITDRVKCKDLLNVVSDPLDVVRKIIPRRGAIVCSGMGQMGTPKAVPTALAKYVEETNERFELTVYASGSAAPELDSLLAKIGAVRRRYTYIANPTIRDEINRGSIDYYDLWLGEFPRQLKYGFLNDVAGPVDVVIVEAVGIEEDGSIIPALSVDNIPTFINLAKRVVVEINMLRPIELKGIHDIYIPKPGEPIPIARVSQRVGLETIPCDPKKIVAVVPSEIPDKETFYGKPTKTEERIVNNLFDFLLREVDKGRIPKNLFPIQTGAGPIGDVIASKIAESNFNNVEVWSEITQISYIDALDTGKVSAVSSSNIYIPTWERGRREARFMEKLEEYKKHIILRPLEVTNSHEVIGRLNVISMNQAVEIDIYGFVNSTHVLGINVINGVGGSGEFARASYLSIFLTPSTARDGKVSRIVPMVTHVDIADHDVDVIVTEHGWADLRGLSPRERAKEIIEKCSSPEYKDELWSYFDEACRKVGGHMPHILSKAFLLHERFIETGSMK